MRLICGVMRLDGTAATEENLHAMAAPMDLPRLRSSLRLWRDGPVGLAVLDFSARGGAAPVLPQTTHSVMAADVRLDDPVALGRNLGLGGSESEDALLLAALECLGPSGLDQVLGDFAFASWNRDAQQLICARDAFGIRPFAYVHRLGELFAFASFPKALHGSGIVRKKIDEDAIARRLVDVFRADDCLIAGIKRLPPAHAIAVSREGISLLQYWEPNRAAIGTRRLSPEEAARELRRLIDQAVDCRLPRNGEVGAHLSGGLDSSAIAVLAARRLRQENRTLHAYSFLDRQRNDVTPEDETEFVRTVLAQEGDIDWTALRPPAAVAALDKLVDVDTMIPLNPARLGHAACARAEEQGVGVILSGWGGDEAATFNGKGALAEMFLSGRWRTLAREIAALKRERGWPVSRIIYGELVSSLFPAPGIALAKRLAGRSGTLADLMLQSLSPDARRKTASEKNRGATAAGREYRWQLITNPLIADRAEGLAQTGARHGLAFAFPLLDRRVVEFALSLSSDLFLRGGYRRRAFRDAMADVLPANVRLRHEKYAATPSRVVDLAESKEAFLTDIAAGERNESARRLIDFSQLRRLVGTFLSADDVRLQINRNFTPSTAASMVAVARVLAAAAYIEQHGGEMDKSEPDVGPSQSEPGAND